MDLATFLESIIVDGISAAKIDYKETSDAHKLSGAIAGFEACRGKTPKELATLLGIARNEMQAAFVEEKKDYWFFRCKEAEIEWVCNCVSAALINEGFDPIVTPTARGELKANQILTTL